MTCLTDKKRFEGRCAIVIIRLKIALFAPILHEKTTVRDSVTVVFRFV